MTDFSGDRQHGHGPQHGNGAHEPDASPQADPAAGDELAESLSDDELAELTRLDWEDPGPDDPRYWEDLDRLAPAWASLPPEEEARLLAEADPETLSRSPGVAEVIDAGFTHRSGGSGTGFAAGGALDAMLPGCELASQVAWARRDLGKLSDDALIGLMDGARKLEAWSAELKHAAVAELDARRVDADGAEGEHVAAEIGAALRQTRRSAQITLERARGLERLARVAALLANGIIDMPRADVLLRRLELLSDEHAAMVLDRILPRAGEMTTGELGAACDRAIMAVDPQAALRRREKAQKEARVEAWTEDSGTAALAGRDLPPADVIAAGKRLDADAQWLGNHGVEGSWDQLRAMAYTARLNGIPLESLVPADPAGSDVDAASAGTVGTGGTAGTGGAAGAGRPACTSAEAAATVGWPALAGSVNLTMPASAFLGLTDNPGEVASYGPVDAGTSRELARRLAAAGPATKWCLTLVNEKGQAVGHGCARAGPPPGTGPPGTSPGGSSPRGSSPPGGISDQLAWLADIKITSIATGICGHEREVPGYRPPESLRHLIKIRSPRCGEPGCRTPAHRCDDDHTIPYHLGGKTCECNLHPLCRRSHRTKQARGWHVSQPEPGVLVWTLPSGRVYTKINEPYPV
jgi:hypothetical protein